MVLSTWAFQVFLSTLDVEESYKSKGNSLHLLQLPHNLMSKMLSNFTYRLPLKAIQIALSQVIIKTEPWAACITKLLTGWVENSIISTTLAPVLHLSKDVNTHLDHLLARMVCLSSYTVWSLNIFKNQQAPSLWSKCTNSNINTH